MIHKLGLHMMHFYHLHKRVVERSLTQSIGSEAEKYYPIYWVLAFTMGIHIDTAQIEFEFPLISDRSFF